MARVTLENVNKIYGSGQAQFHAVKDLNLAVDDGEFVALLGPSGCGKTSTLRMIVGLEAITSGAIKFDDQVVNDLAPERRNVAMAFETYALYPNFTVAENLGFPLEVRGVPEADRERQVARIAKLLRIEPILDHKPGQLSGGQQQRVSLGRALIREPAAFILDEVMSHLDAHLKFQMLFELKRIHQSVGKTTIYVTHDQVEALALADRVAVMANAELQQFGSRDELYHRPVNKFVADFIGEPPTNFFEGEIAEANGYLSVQICGAHFALHPTAERAALLRRRNERTVLIGVRPQNLSIVPIAGGERFDANLALNEYLGEQAILTFDSNGVAFRALAAPDAAHDSGQRVSVHYRREDVMLFDPKTEAFIG
jgi:multiple sugar transport system ATP-binding protein